MRQSVKIVLRILVLLLIIFNCSIHAQSLITLKTEEEYLNQPDSLIDLAAISLKVEKQIHPNININKYLKIIDSLTSIIAKESINFKNDSEIINLITIVR